MTEPVGSSRGMRPTNGQPDGVAAQGFGPRSSRPGPGFVTGPVQLVEQLLEGGGWLSDGLVGVALVVMTVSGAVYLIGSIVG